MSLLKKTKNIVMAIIILGAVCTVVIWQISKMKREAEREDRIKHTVGDMVTKYDALTNWGECFVDYRTKIDGGDRAINTIDIENALITNDHRPVLFYGYAADVKKINEKKFVVIFSMIENADINFVLRCDAEQVEKILGQPTEYSADSFAVVAVISNVQRPRFEVDAYQDDEYEPYIIVEPSDTFIANGGCLDLLFVGDYEPSKD